MTLYEETAEIVTNAQAAYQTGELTADEYCEVTRIPLKDKALEEE